MPQPPPNWEPLKDLIADALELAPDQREAFLVQSCNGNSELLDEARSLVAAYESADGVIDRRTDAWLGLGGPDLLALNGQRIGRYVLEKLLAEGAMAAVYLARQANPQRAVALKLLRCSLPLIDASTRFRRESQALGRLQHPNIARIYEAGVHQPPGQQAPAMPFIAMEYVDGPPLTAYARNRQLSREDRIRLMIKVASAVHAAHQQAVIHRDLKPANVLVDSNGEPKVLDFGIALIVGSEDAYQTWQTTAGVLLGTPGYMSPEQAAGRANEVDVRSDVWALGVLLHELLTGELPIDVRNTTSIAEILKRIETLDPLPIGRIDRTLRGGDLETVVTTALSREKERRYPSAQAFADDLNRVLNYEPITARAPSRWYRTRKFVRRHRVALGVSAGFVLLLAAAAIVASIGFVLATRERDNARAISLFLQEMISSADPNIGGGRDVTVLQALNAAEGRIGRAFSKNPLSEAEVRSTLGWTYYNLSQYDQANQQLTRAVALRLAAGRPADPETIDDQCRLATILRWQYRPKEAMEVARGAYNVAVTKLGPEHPSTVALLDPLAGAAHDMGDLETAEREYLKAVATNRKVMGEANEQTLTAMNNLAVVYIDRAKYREAEEILRELVGFRTRTLPPRSLSLITTRLNLIVTISEQGRLTDAEQELRQLSTDAEHSLGADHDSTIVVRTNHAEILQRLGRVDEALAIQKDAMDRRISAHGMAHDLSIKETSNYSSMLNQAEQWEQAREHAKKALDAALSLHGEEHMTAAASKGNLAAALDGLKQHAEAQRLYREVIAFYEKQLGPEHPRTMIQRNNLSLSLLGEGRSAEAAAMLQALLELVEKKQMSSMEPSVRRNLGRALTLEKHFDQAEYQLLSAYRTSESRNEGRNLLKTAQALADLYDAWQRPDDAKRWRQTVAGLVSK